MCAAYALSIQHGCLNLSPIEGFNKARYSYPHTSNSVKYPMLDGRGRFTLPKELREQFGEHYHIVQLEDSIKLVPIEDDPFNGL